VVKTNYKDNDDLMAYIDLTINATKAVENSKVPIAALIVKSTKATRSSHIAHEVIVVTHYYTSTVHNNPNPLTPYLPAGTAASLASNSADNAPDEPGGR
jgi:hypothetical protein